MTSAFTYSCTDLIPSPSLPPVSFPLIQPYWVADSSMAWWSNCVCLPSCLSICWAPAVLQRNYSCPESCQNPPKSPSNPPFYFCPLSFNSSLFYFRWARSNSINTPYLLLANAVQLHAESHPAHYHHRSHTGILHHAATQSEELFSISVWFIHR